MRKEHLQSKIPIWQQGLSQLRTLPGELLAY